MISINKVLEHTLQSKRVVLYDIVTDAVIESESELKDLKEIKDLLNGCCECSVSNRMGKWSVEVVVDV